MPKIMKGEDANPQAQLRAALELAGDAFDGTVKTVEGVHQSIVGTIAKVIPAAHPVGWVSGFVYARVRNIGQLSFGIAAQGAGLVQALRPGSAASVPSDARLGVLAALNGAFGDHLETRGNDLAIPMAFCVEGEQIALTREALDKHLPNPTGSLVILLHGLCLNELQWRHAGEPDFGDRLDADLGYTALRLRYNSGRHISTNGKQFAALMETLIAAYPEPIEKLTIIGHSMGGLVARSACYYADKAGHNWVNQLTELVCLGSPHLGAPLERLGHWFTHSLTRTPFTEPLSSLGKIRSAGIKDLRHCYLLDEDWHNRDLDARESAKPRPLPRLKHVRYYNVAATLGHAPNDRMDRWFGDLLVPVTSAITNANANSGSGSGSRAMNNRGRDGRVFFGMSHFRLIHDPDVYAAIYAWLTGKPQRSRRASKAQKIKDDQVNTAQ